MVDVSDEHLNMMLCSHQYMKLRKAMVFRTKHKIFNHHLIALAWSLFDNYGDIDALDFVLECSSTSDINTVMEELSMRTNRVRSMGNNFLEIVYG